MCVDETQHVVGQTAHCECVHRYDDYEMPKTPLFGVVPGGAHKESHMKAQVKGIERGLTKYKGARQNGLRPEAPTVSGVDQSEMQAESFDRARRSPIIEEIEGRANDG
jgi:hypothetical protein